MDEMNLSTNNKEQAVPPPPYTSVNHLDGV